MTVNSLRAITLICFDSLANLPHGLNSNIRQVFSSSLIGLQAQGCILGQHYCHTYTLKEKRELEHTVQGLCLRLKEQKRLWIYEENMNSWQTLIK